MREAPSVGQYIKQYDKQSGKHCGNKYVATTVIKRKSYFKQSKPLTFDNSLDFMTKIGLNNTIEKLVCNLFSVKLTYMRNGSLERKTVIFTLTYK